MVAAAPRQVGGSSMMAPRPRAIRVPTGFPWTPAWSIRRELSGRFVTNISEASLRRATTSTLYVSIDDGLDSNLGTNPLLPKKSISAAINLWTNATIYVLGAPVGAPPVVYPVDHSWASGVPFGQEQNIIVVSSFATLAPGRAISSVAMLPGGADLGASWAAVGGATPNVYSIAVAASPYSVIDASVIDSNGIPTAAVNRGSVALCQANLGSWYWSAGTLYVSRSAGTAPDANVRPLKAATINGWLNTPLSIYVEGLTFEGGNARCFFWQSVGAECAMVDCDATHGQGEGISVNSLTPGVAMGLTFIRCRAFAMMAGDGFQYTITGAATTLNVAEIECTGSDNGRNGGPNQGSTGHVAAGTVVNIIRAGCVYAGNEAQELADVGDGSGNGGCSVWMLGCVLDARATSGYGYTAGDRTVAWMQGCIIQNAAIDLQTNLADGAINVSDTLYATTDGPGLIQGYVP